MEVGMNLPVMVPGLGRDALVAWSRGIDEGPFSHLASGERVSFPNPEMLVTLSAAAALTERVRIFANVLILPMHATGLAAKQLATLDVLSGGRLELGVGAGARVEDYRCAEATFDDRRVSRMGEQVAMLRALWRGECVIEGVESAIEPAPLQPRGPRVLAGSLSPRSIRSVSRWADGVCGFSFGPSIDEVRSSFELARTAWREAGRREPPRLVTSCFFALGKDARAQLDAFLGRYLAFMGPGVAASLAPIVATDSKAKLAEVIRGIADAGADELSLVPTTLDPDELARVADVIAASPALLP